MALRRSVGAGAALAVLVVWSASCTGNDPVLASAGDGAAAGDASTSSDAENPTDAGGEAKADLDAETTALVTRPMIALGTSTTCALRADGAVYCWGSNKCGNLGIGNESTGGFRPGLAALPVKAARLVGGPGFFCALATDGKVWCWGNNATGAMGRPPSEDPTGAPCDQPHARTPRMVPDLDGIVEIGAGGGFACARKKDGSVSCWGSNGVYQLGHKGGDVGCLGSASCNPKPTTIAGFKAEALALGWFHGCARTSSGVSCWGGNSYDALGHPAGQAGDENLTGGETANPTPQPVLGAAGAIDVAGGANFACATKVDKHVVCWGIGNIGQLGSSLGGSMSTASPTLVPVVDSVVGLGLGGTHACVIWPGYVTCWGNNGQAQVGPFALDSALPPSPTLGPGLGMAQVVASERHTCALSPAGVVSCWGTNIFGELGHDPLTDPVDVCETPCSKQPTAVAGFP